MVGQLGMTGLGTLYHAEDIQSGREVAVRALQGRPTPELEARLRRLVGRLRGVEHPCLLRFLDVGSIDGWLYYATELLDGWSLDRELVVRGRVAPERAAVLVADAAAGLAALHGAGLLHLDLKVSSLFVTRDDAVKVLDTGVQAVLSGMAEPVAGLAAPEVIGTPQAQAPEQALAAEVDERTDVYALGAVLYHALTGSPPFRGITSHVVAAHLGAVPSRPSNIVRGVPAELDDVILRAMAKEPGERFASMDELRQALGGIVG
jgi:serine/threonine-protein kinase